MASRTSRRPRQSIKGKNIAERVKPYTGSRPLGESTRANRKHSVSPRPSESEESDQQRKSERRICPDLGLPTLDEYETVEQEYIAALDQRKKAKALISQEMFDDILLVLRSPGDQIVRTAQFRWWVRKMFRLEERLQIPSSVLLGQALRGNLVEVVIHDGKEVAVKENIYPILCFHHEVIGHGGRDRTAAEVRKHYTWIPKELVAGFIRTCPTCIFKRTGKCDEERAAMYAKEKEARVSAADELLARSDHARDDVEDRRQHEANLLSSSLFPFSSLPLPNAMLPQTLGFSSFNKATAGHHNGGSILDTLPGLVPWYLSSVGPSCGPSNLTAPSLPAPPGRRFHASANVPEDDLRFQTAFDEHVRLPSIHTCGRASQDSERVNLPSLSQLLELSAPLSDGPLLEQHPLQAISQASGVNPHISLLCDAHGIPYRYPTHTHYSPQIDPSLMPGGVHMLAFAAECAQIELNASGERPETQL
ncbi:hypothetical protein BN946_scf184836.g53 [Trametes cinnabarina]|uniref:Integrase zinc-binding domain-containing protein n=1 Tax=Pycnoporus cinnabarinus TaxID=5643 RepID=A0A060SCH3_PYCCI|nr:hypothetical protein BN946_scf184836.g53 [Trametes cinnabarina]